MKVYWLWLAGLNGIGPVTQRKLLEALETPERIYLASAAEISQIAGRAVAAILTASRSLDSAKRQEEALDRLGIRLLTTDDPLYPEQAKCLSNAPVILYYRGRIRPKGQSIGIVGSRRCTPYGKQVAVEAATYLAEQGVTVISGMAKGIDSYAHTACLKAGGYTLAFLGNGVDVCYPAEHRGLMEEIIHHGAVISEYPPYTRPRQEYFPIRNALISAWSDKVLIVEAAEKSGALITAQKAIEQGREVFSVPNSIYAKESAGTNKLLSVGAKAYLGPEFLFASDPAQTADAADCTSPVKPRHARHTKKPSKKPSSIAKNNTGLATLVLTPLEQRILSRLTQPLSLSSLLDLTDGDMQSLLDWICTMELEGKLKVKGQMVEAGSWGRTPK
ncbi:DNA-processing protein DprA [Paradesulfitobacterium ferrireducens]|uniref:DNA-processing protein DprA n=1 Tax=Paradesulfitobacterium ferrireducens TaxID=2816476 RepID=UPI001A8FCF45|nr:DNA-processing protein DprA [Paradesulfitobacterium ferrireducens]